MHEMVFNSILALILGLFMVLGLGIAAQSNPADLIEAKGFPVIFSVLALVLLLGIVRDHIKASRNATGKARKQSDLEGANTYKLLMIIALSTLFILFVDKVGFVLFTLALVFIFINILGSKKQGFNLLFSVLTVAALTLIFGRFFGISLPRGVGLLRELSFHLY